MSDEQRHFRHTWPKLIDAPLQFIAPLGVGGIVRGGPDKPEQSTGKVTLAFELRAACGVKIRDAIRLVAGVFLRFASGFLDYRVPPLYLMKPALLHDVIGARNQRDP